MSWSSQAQQHRQEMDLSQQASWTWFVRNKARLVAQGYTRMEGIDFDETFALVARLEAIRMLLAYANHNNILMYQMDVKSAFLNGKIEKEVYVAQPPGFEDPKRPDMV